MSNEINKIKETPFDRNYYNRNTWDILWDMITKVNPDIEFTKEQVRLTEVINEFNPNTNRNTQGKLVGIPEMGREGEYIISWDRISLRDVFKNDIYVPYNPDALFISDYLSVFNKAFRFKLSTSDIYDEAVTINDLPQKITVRFRESCPSFIESFDLYIGNPKLSIGLVMKEGVLDGVSLPGFKLGYYYGPMLYWAEDFTGISEQLATLTPGIAIEGDNASYFKLILNEPWVDAKEGADYNFHGSYVYYNGPVSKSPVPANDNYSHVLVINLNENFCLNVSGYLLLHYNPGALNEPV